MARTRSNNDHTRQQGDRRLFCDLGEIQLDIAAEDHICTEYDRITDRQYQRSVGIAQQERDRVDRHARDQPNAADPLSAGDLDKILFGQRVAAEDREYRDISEIVRVHVHTGEAVFKYDKADVEDLDLDARHQARQPDDPQHGGTVDNKGADRIKLAAEIEMLFGMYAVEDEKADRRKGRLRSLRSDE